VQRQKYNIDQVDMMLAQSSKQQMAGPVLHPRRPRAHLSVSLRHDDVPTSPQQGETGQADRANAATTSPNQQDFEESGQSGESNVENWFERSNNRSGTGYDPQFEDSEYRSSTSAAELGLLTVA
jgi:hypothetical protein